MAPERVTSLVALVAASGEPAEGSMEVTAWRVIWYEAHGHEIESADFVDESEAWRQVARVKAGRLGSAVTLNMLCQPEEATTAGLRHDGWDPVEAWDIR